MGKVAQNRNMYNQIGPDSTRYDQAAPDETKWDKISQIAPDMMVLDRIR